MSIIAASLLQAAASLGNVPAPVHVWRFLCALDDLVGHVSPTPWGAVVSAPRFPQVWDVNYARVDAQVAVTGAAVLAELTPVVSSVGASHLHVVIADEEVHRDLLADLSTAGHGVSWDQVMTSGAKAIIPSARPSTREVEEFVTAAAQREAITMMADTFGINPGAGYAQTISLETDELVPAGKRWFGIRDDAGSVVSVGAVLVLDGVGYLDGIATRPAERGRGYASATTAALCAAAARAHVTRTFLLADPEAPAVVRMYERLGFRRAGLIASTKAPVT